MSLCAHLSYVSLPPCFLHSTLPALGTVLHVFLELIFSQIRVKEERTQEYWQHFILIYVVFHNVSGERLVGQASNLISFYLHLGVERIECANGSVCADLMSSLLSCHLGLLIPGAGQTAWLMNQVFYSRTSVPSLQGIVRPVTDCL